jgi:hypothetical protein
MKFSLHMKTLALAGLASFALSAQQSMIGWHAGGGFDITSHMSTQDELTHQGAGFNLQGGYTNILAKSDVLYRLTLGMNYLPGTDGLVPNTYTPTLDAAVDQTTRNNLVDYQFAADILVQTPWKHVYLVTGLSANRWIWDARSVVANNSAAAPAGTVLYDTHQTVKGIKIGGRIGLLYEASDHFQVNAILQPIELGTSLDGTSFGQGSKGLNVNFVELSVAYHF